MATVWTLTPCRHTHRGDPGTPTQVGVLDYGNGYAAKSGSAWVQSGGARRLLFGFTGWQEPTMLVRVRVRVRVSEP